MAKVDKEFNLRDWEWIAVHFPPSEREAMAKVAWLICCKCTPEEIYQYNLDPRIVIPLCGIELLDEIDVLKLKEFAKEKEVDNYAKILAESKTKRGNSNRVKQEFINPAINSINSSQKWQSLFKTLAIVLQFTLLYRLIYNYRYPTRNDWNDIFLDVKYKFFSQLYLLVMVVFTVLVSMTGVLLGDFFLEYILSNNLVVFLSWFIRFLFASFYGYLIFTFTEKFLPFYQLFFNEKKFQFFAVIYTLTMLFLMKTSSLEFLINVIFNFGITGIILVLIAVSFDLLFYTFSNFSPNNIILGLLLTVGIYLFLLSPYLLLYLSLINVIFYSVIIGVLSMISLYLYFYIRSYFSPNYIFGFLFTVEIFWFLLSPYLLFLLSLKITLLTLISVSVVSSIFLFIFAKAILDKATNPLRDILKSDGSVNLISLVNLNFDDLLSDN
ncbi:MAG: hypothetical protein SWX82_15110 [Cyanobacteriota bacterium]|nr:hypothetical protein [Cyanobacteriota bacterium]